MSGKVLEVKNLTKKFGKFVAVDNISFDVSRGEIVGFLGPNGAGKTTTIMMLLGIISPTAGEIKMFGLDFLTHKQEILARMNYSSAYAKLPWRLKVWETLYVFSQLYGVENSNQRITELLEAFSLTKRRDTMIGDLSSGNQTRVNLCKAFINNPQIVLLDEPTSSLDPDVATRVRGFIRQSRSKFKTSILITSHNMAEIEELCDRVIFLNKGKIIAEDTPSHLAKNLKNTVVRLMPEDDGETILKFCAVNKLKAKFKKPFIEIFVKESEVTKLLNNLALKEIAYSEISIDKPTLEDFFLKEVRHV